MTQPVILQRPPRLFECPMCGHRKSSSAPLGVIHECPNLGGVSVPMQHADRHGIVGETHHVTVVERGDYLAGAITQHGPVMAVHANRADGSHDTVVFAPTATRKARS